MPARTLSMLLVLTLGACAGPGLLPDWLSQDVAGPLPAHRFIIANRLKSIIGDPDRAGTLEISTPRRVTSLKGASWLVCIKIRKFPLLPRYYAAFIQRDQIVDSRLSVLIDQCELQSFVPFDWAADANNPPL